MKVLITGASGFLGGHLVELVAEKGCKAVGMVRKARDTSILDQLGVEKRVADLTDPVLLLNAVRGMEAAVHLAAYCTFHGKKELWMPSQLTERMVLTRQEANSATSLGIRWKVV